MASPQLSKAYLTFRSQPPFNSISSISSLLAADPSQLSNLNNVSQDATFETNKTVLVPVNCSCSAIKKVSRDVSEQINLLNKINHLNLIRLSAFCFNDGYWYLFYEFAANGASTEWIYSKNAKQKKFLNWKQRIQIGLDVAPGLNYLHSYTSPPHVHKDLKCGNVLLAGEFRAKISNFALARSADDQGGQFALTRHIIGTKEILNPVLQETVGPENLSELMDSSVGGNYPSELAILIIKLFDGRIKKDPFAGPGMHEIVQALSTTLTATISWESKLSV
ncbi:hypothetical protein ACH5RR_011356 [Cinchona calisaya]|uniref:Protein kinase domain-containing protein n=1 Tax=Cinchona calisaya TaxID=153742 RepID=A0ABD3A4M1_9GENT